MSINEVRYLPECGSTNAYVKEHFEEFGPVAAVYTENQTAGRGRLGRSWVNAEGKALYYTVAIKEPLAQPATLPLLASLAVRRQLQLRYGVDCQIKWPNDLLLNGKKIVGILCESVSYGYQQQGRGILCGIGINLAQPQSYFDAADLPHGTSLALQGANVDLTTDPEWLAEALTDFGFDRPMYVFARDGFAPFREEYKKACVNIGRRVPFDLPGGGEGSGGLLFLCLSGRQSRLGIALCLLGIGDSRLSGIELTLGSLHIGVRCIEFCLRVLDGLLGGLVLIHAHGLELGLGVIEGFLGFVTLCVGILERLGLFIDALVGLIELAVQVAQLLLLLLGLVDGRLKLVDLLLKRGDFCRVLLGRVVAQGLCSMVSLLLRLLLRLARRVGLLLGRIVSGLSVLELLCRLLGQLGSRLYDRLVTGDNGFLYRTTPPLNRIAIIG